MGVTTYPCPHCSQQQRVEHENSQEVRPALCPACLEAFLSEEAVIKQLAEKYGRHPEEPLTALRLEFGLISAKEYNEAVREALGQS
jgi:endogenous inhibitor of DNA gyrase (YacG/DUF329 family)